LVIIVFFSFGIAGAQESGFEDLKYACDPVSPETGVDLPLVKKPVENKEIKTHKLFTVTSPIIGTEIIPVELIQNEGKLELLKVSRKDLIKSHRVSTVNTAKGIPVYSMGALGASYDIVILKSKNKNFDMKKGGDLEMSVLSSVSFLGNPTYKKHTLSIEKENGLWVCKKNKLKVDNINFAGGYLDRGVKKVEYKYKK
jgi:hypothetical protein